MYKGKKHVRIIWPLLLAVGLLWGLSGVGTVAAQEPEPEWYLIPVSFSVSNAYLEGSISNVNCTLDATGHHCTHTSSGWVRHHHLYTLASSPEDLGLNGWGTVHYGDESLRPLGAVYALVVDSYTSNQWRIDALADANSIVKSSQNAANIYDGVACFVVPNSTGNQVPAVSGVDCDTTRSLGGNLVYPSPTSNLFSWGWRSNVGGAHSFGIRSISYLVYGVPPAPPAPPAAPLYQTSCLLTLDPSGAVISATATLTDTPAITGTTTITTPANLVINPSFELTENNILPSHWQFEHPLVAPSMWQDDNGGKAIRSAGVPRHELRQTIPLPPAPAYLIGMDINYTSGTAPVRWVVNGVERWSHGTATDGWQVITDTYNLTGELGSPGNDNTFKDFQVVLPDTAALGDIAIDNLHLVPVEVDESGNVLGVYCAAVGEAYTAQPPPTAPVDPSVPSASQSAWGLVLPLTNSGAICFECRFPTGMGAEAAIAWLGCILRNLFACDLRGWLYDINNAVLGVWAGQNGIATWWHGTINGGVNWAAGFGLAWASSGIEAFNNYAGYLNSITSVTGDSAAASRSLLAIGDVAPEDQPLLVQMFTLWLAPFFLDWATTSITAYNNYVEYLNTVPTTFVIMVDGVAGGGSWAELIYELLRGLFTLVAGLIFQLVDGLAQILNLIRAIIGAIFSAWSVEPLTLQEFTALTYGSETAARFDMTAPPMVGDGAAAADVTRGQMIYFMWGLAAVDSVFNDFRLFWIPVLASAAVVWATFMWFISRWDIVLPNF